MINLKRSIFWVSLYLVIIFVVAQADYFNRPIINFASYFYLAVMIAIPVTLLFPSITKAPYYVPLLIWGGIYLVLLEVLDRASSTKTIDYAVIVLEFILLELGVWLTYLLREQIRHAESLMEALAVGTFPNRAKDIDLEYQRIKIEFARSRRYNRPLSLIVLAVDTDEDKSGKKMLSSLQHDMSFHFQSARAGQIIDDYVRQTDMLMKERKGRFVILCPETERETAIMLAQRIAKTIKEKTEFSVRCGVAAFPSDVLTFEDLLQKAHKELINSSSLEVEEMKADEIQEP